MARPGFLQSLPEFFRMFSEERACVQFVIDSRWPDGKPVCPKCGFDTTYPRKDRPEGRKCAKCGYIFSVTAGTVMENMLGIAGKGKGPTQAALYARAAGHSPQGGRPG